MIGWLTVLGILVFGVAPDSAGMPVMRQRVDMIELNHFVDEEGREVFQQVIFYDWSTEHKRFHVRAWRLVKKPSQVPKRRWDPPMYQCTWNDERVLRQVWAPSMRETWSQQDPERVNRTLLPEDQRIPLFVPQVAKQPDNTRTR